jgi:hypothetical protein
MAHDFNLPRGSNPRSDRPFSRSGFSLNDPPLARLGFAQAIAEIANGLKIPHDAAEMVLCGLCAVGDVRMQNSRREVIEPGDCALGELRGADGPAIISAADLHHHLEQWSAPPPISRDAEIDRV